VSLCSLIRELLPCDPFDKKLTKAGAGWKSSLSVSGVPAPQPYSSLFFIFLFFVFCFQKAMKKVP